MKNFMLIGGVALFLSGCGGESVRTGSDSIKSSPNIKNSSVLNENNYIEVAQRFYQKQLSHTKRKGIRGYKAPRSYPGKSRKIEDHKNSFILSSSEPFNGKFKQYTVKYNNIKTITQIDESNSNVRVTYFKNGTKEKEASMSIDKFYSLQGDR
jgi:hypothetical protein